MPDEKESNWEYISGQDLARNRASGIYYAIKHFRGLPTLNKSTGHTDPRKARKELPRLIRAHLDRYESGQRAPGESPTVGEVIDEVEETESPSLRKKTQAKRTFYFKRIRDEMGLGHLPIDQLSLKLWIARLEKVRAKRQRKTYWDYVKHANILIRYAYEQKYISHYITIANPDPMRETGTVFTTPEIQRLFSVMNEGTRDQFVLSYECCMRLREMLHLSWDRVDLESGEITLRAQDVKTGSKTGKGRKFIATPHALERLRRRKAEQIPPSPWVFPSPTGKGPVDDNKTAWNAAKTLVLEGDERLGIKGDPTFQHWGTWHHLRHTAISLILCEEKMNITMVSEYVGTSVSTLQKVYLHSKAEHTKGVTDSLRITNSK
jgi:integrase